MDLTGGWAHDAHGVWRWMSRKEAGPDVRLWVPGDQVAHPVVSTADRFRFSAADEPHAGTPSAEAWMWNAGDVVWTHPMPDAERPAALLTAVVAPQAPSDVSDMSAADGGGGPVSGYLLAEQTRREPKVINEAYVLRRKSWDQIVVIGSYSKYIGRGAYCDLRSDSQLVQCSVQTTDRSELMLQHIGEKYRLQGNYLTNAAPAQDAWPTRVRRTDGSILTLRVHGERCVLHPGDTILVIGDEFTVEVKR